MSLTPTEVKKIAHLSKLLISDAEIQPLTQNLDNILGFIGKMPVNIEELEPLAHPIHAMQSLRPDVVTETNQRDLFLKNAPQSYMGLYLVPAVISVE